MVKNNLEPLMGRKLQGRKSQAFARDLRFTTSGLDICVTSILRKSQGRKSQAFARDLRFTTSGLKVTIRGFSMPLNYQTRQ